MARFRSIAALIALASLAGCSSLEGLAGKTERHPSAASVHMGSEYKTAGDTGLSERHTGATATGGQTGI